MTIGLAFAGGMCLLLASFAFLPATDEERRNERESWNPRKPMAPSNRLFRQRMQVLHAARWPLIVLGVALLFGAAASALS